MPLNRPAFNMPITSSPLNNFTRIYQKLPPFSRLVLQLASVIHEPINLSTLLKCLYDCEISTDVPRADYARQIHPCLAHLREKNLLNARCQCRDDIAEIVARQAVEEGHFNTLAQAVRAVLPSIPISYKADKSASRRDIRDLRIALYSNDTTAFHQHLINYYQRSPAASSPHPIVNICGRAFSASWMATMPDHIQFLALHEILKDHQGRLQPITVHLNYLEYGIDGERPPMLRHPSFMYLLVSSLLLCGEFERAEKILAAHGGQLTGLGLDGWLAVLKGNMEEALTIFMADLQTLRQINNDEEAYFTGFEGVLFFLALLQSKSPEAASLRHKIYTDRKPLKGSRLYRQTYQILFDVFICRQKQVTDPQLRAIDYSPPAFNSISSLFAGLAAFWLEGRMSPELQAALTDNFERAALNGYHWLAQEMAEVLYLASGDNGYQEAAAAWRNNWQSQPLLKAIHHEEPWQRAVRGLRSIINHAAAVNEQSIRLIWLLTIDETSGAVIAITPKEQKFSHQTGWSKGRVLSLQKLALPSALRDFSTQDKNICAAIHKRTGNSRNLEYYFDIEQAVLTMINHPLIFRDHEELIHLEIIQAEPQLRIKNERRNVAIKFTPFPAADETIITRFSPPGRIMVYQLSETSHKIAATIGAGGLLVPEKAKSKVLDLLAGIAGHIPVYSDFSAPAATLRNITSDSKIYCQIVPNRGGFDISFNIKPLGAGGPTLKPGAGARIIIADIDGERLQTIRNLSMEEEAAHDIVSACPSMSCLPDDNWHWLLPDLQDCLNFLLELQPLANNLVIEWPQGENLRIKQRAGVEQLYLKVNKHKNWFAINGKLQVDDNHLIEIRQLLDLVKQHNSRFVPLSDQEYLSLTEDLFQHLNDINAITSRQDDLLRLPQAAAPLLHNLTANLGKLESDEHWLDAARRIDEAEAYIPDLPSTLNASLRSYQREGFTWMARLAYLNCGACLADEMGLGKTVQALALMLDQAAHGPCLVLAPTSVCYNWINEAQRFAPTLNCISLNPTDRQQTIDELRPFDLLITSYGLLQQEAEMLTARQWQVIVLDEAQAIKNMATKRSKAAMRLKGRFKMITTGTPLENNLGELWNLFNFINPGILGSITSFNHRFAIPIERDKSREAQQRLKKIIRPFILRRLKSQVLDDLPPRTEINLHVKLSPEEAAFYETLRREALNILETAPQQHRNMRILAEIMRLRQACCNPAMVEPGIPIKSSKLALFEELIDELLLNGHKVLVFSQFVGHLTILKNFLDHKEINYQYLDGSTPARERKKRVEAFQAGEGDIFLISLKAGGLGLNLTAANYVIHMDPWWNPAVEDQASDRIHRIGQKRPVTIYRLITRDTIEEKIVTLHKEKRELADNLLQGTDLNHKISATELLALLQDDDGPVRQT